MPGTYEHWSTVLLARKSTLATLAERTRPLTQLASRVPVPRFAQRGNGRPWMYVAQGAALLGVVAGTVAFASYDKSVTLTVDGKTSSIHAFGSNVHDMLASKHIAVGPHDLVSPSPSASVHDGEHLILRYGRRLSVDVDGQQRSYWTTALTVNAALAEIGLRDDNAALSVSRDEPLGRQGLSMSLTNPKQILVSVDGRKVEQTTTAVNVGVLLQQLGITLGPEDTVSVPLTAALTPGLNLAVTRILTKTKTVTAKIAMPVHATKDSSLARGKTKVITKGRAGKQHVTYQLIYKNGKLAQKIKVTVVVVTAAKTQVEKVGSKGPAGGTAGDPGAPGGSAASLNWAALAKCESGGNPKAVNPSGYYGLYQFSLSTWHSVGGKGNPINASSAEQTHRAEILYNKAGAGQWTCGSHLFD
jgi:resuscitation-promoting factor RpfB